MKRNYYSLLLPLTLFFIGCPHQAPRYRTIIPLSEQTATAESTDLTVNIPVSWKAALDNDSYEIDLWLVNNIYSQALSFVRLNLEGVSDNAPVKLEQAVNYSKLAQMARFNSLSNIFDDQTLMLGKTEVNEYKFENIAKQVYRVLVFKYKDYFYECITYSQDQSKNDELYLIQDAVVNSIK